MLEHPHYTRPVEYRGYKVPDVLMSGNHAAIDKWRKQQSLNRTFTRRPDLLDQIELTSEQECLLKEIKG